MTWQLIEDEENTPSDQKHNLTSSYFCHWVQHRCIWNTALGLSHWVVHACFSVCLCWAAECDQLSETYTAGQDSLHVKPCVYSLLKKKNHLKVTLWRHLRRKNRAKEVKDGVWFWRRRWSSLVQSRDFLPNVSNVVAVEALLTHCAACLAHGTLTWLHWIVGCEEYIKG